MVIQQTFNLKSDIMKKLSLILSLIAISILSFSQNQTFLVLEFMKVSNEQEQAYLETEDFWEQIHAERVKRSEIKSWDLWTLKPGGTSQGYQYVTVTVYDDLVKALEEGNLEEAAAQAYPDMTPTDIQARFQLGNESRELDQRLYIQIIKQTKDDYKKTVGSVIRMNFMYANKLNYKAYEEAEEKLFMPVHQKAIEDKEMSHWGLGRVVLPSGTQVKTTHITFDVYSGYPQLIESYNIDDEILPEKETLQNMDAAFETRDLSWNYLATLIKHVE